MAQIPGHKKIGAEVFGEVQNMALENNGENKMVRKATNGVIEHVPEKRTLVDYILHRNANLIGHILRRNCLLQEGLITEVNRVGRT